MKSIQWNKSMGKGEHAVVIGSLEISVPTADEIASLPRTGEGWSLEAVYQLVVSAAKVKAASYFCTLLNGMEREQAEKLTKKWLPSSKAPATEQVNIITRKAVRDAVSVMKEFIGVDEIRKKLAEKFDSSAIESALIAEGLIEEPEAEEEEAEESESE